MAFNRIADLAFDKQNPRTAQREIPAGKISPAAAIIFTIACIIGFVTSTWFINSLCYFLSPVALAVILGYSYTKRFTALSHFILGLGLSLAPVGAYLAVTGQFSLEPVLLGAAVLCWVSGFDIIYALQDDSFDRKLKLYSVPVWLGRRKALIVSSVVHLLSISALIIIGMTGHFGPWYWTGFTIFLAMLVYQHLIVKPNDLSRVNIAFATTNGIASVLFATFVLIDIF
jgi:4-hydroxybenzoate polyprenyltransferase